MAIQRRRATGKTKKQELGRKHQQNRARMLARMTDGESCWWCSEPMYREPEANPDGRPLAADHEVARANGGIKASRLLHFVCNSQRGDGEHDYLRPAVTGRPYETPKTRANENDPDGRAQWTLLDWS